MSDGRESGGLFAALKSVAATLLASGKTRLELLGNELEEQKLHVIRLFLLFQGLVLCLGVTVLLVVALITALFWDSRVLVLSVLLLSFLCSVVCFMPWSDVPCSDQRKFFLPASPSLRKIYAN